MPMCIVAAIYLTRQQKLVSDYIPKGTWTGSVHTTYYVSTGVPQAFLLVFVVGWIGQKMAVKVCRGLERFGKHFVLMQP